LSELKTLNTAIVGINTASQDSHLKFARKLNVNFPLLSDKKGLVTLAYGVKHLLGFPVRQTFFIDKNGIIVKVFKSHNNSFNLKEIIELADSQKN